MLQGVARHSSTGIMKAHWNYLDYGDMQLGRLKFTGEDLVLIHDGLKRFSPRRVE